MKQTVRPFVFTSLAAAAALVAVMAPGAAQARPSPDLIVSLAAPAAAAPGPDIRPRVALRVKNLGNAVAWGTTAHPTGYMVDLTLGRDQVVPPGFRAFSPTFAEDALLKGGRVSVTVDLMPGAFHQYAVGAGIPPDTPPGRYYLCATVDPASVVPESREHNNTTCRRITIRARMNVGPQDDFPVVIPEKGQ